MSKKSQSHEGIQGQELRLDLQNSVEARSEPKPRAASYHSRMARYFGMSPELKSSLPNRYSCIRLAETATKLYRKMASLLGSLFWISLPHARSCWVKGMIRTVPGSSELISSHHHQLVPVRFSLHSFRSHQSLHHSFRIG